MCYPVLDDTNVCTSTGKLNANLLWLAGSPVPKTPCRETCAETPKHWGRLLKIRSDGPRNEPLVRGVPTTITRDFSFTVFRSRNTVMFSTQDPFDFSKPDQNPLCIHSIWNIHPPANSVGFTSKPDGEEQKVRALIGVNDAPQRTI